MRKVLSSDKVFQHTGLKQKTETVWRLDQVRWVQPPGLACCPARKRALQTSPAVASELRAGASLRWVWSTQACGHVCSDQPGSKAVMRVPVNNLIRLSLPPTLPHLQHELKEAQSSSKAVIGPHPAAQALAGLSAAPAAKRGGGPAAAAAAAAAAASTGALCLMGRLSVSHIWLARSSG